MRSGSSENDTSGSSGVSSSLAASAFTPPKGSTNTPLGTWTAIALKEKSRRDRSVSMSSEKVTPGLRSSGRYTSLRNVVISRSRPPFLAPTVPNRIPMRYC